MEYIDRTNKKVVDINGRTFCLYAIPIGVVLVAIAYAMGLPKQVTANILWALTPAYMLWTFLLIELLVMQRGVRKMQEAFAEKQRSTEHPSTDATASEKTGA